MRRSLGRLKRLRHDLCNSAPIGLLSHLTELEELSVSTQCNSMIVPFTLTSLPRSLRVISLEYSTARDTLALLPAGHTLQSYLPVLESLWIKSRRTSTLTQETLHQFLSSLPSTLTSLRLLQHNLNIDISLIRTLPRSIKDLELYGQGRLPPGTPIDLPPTLTRLHMPTTGDPRCIYEGLPSTITDFKDEAQTFGMPPLWHLLPRTLLALECSLHILSTELAAQLPPSLLYLRLSFQQAISVETLGALPKHLRYLALHASWDSNPCKGPIEQILAALPKSLTYLDMGLPTTEKTPAHHRLDLAEPVSETLVPTITSDKITALRDTPAPTQGLELLYKTGVDANGAETSTPYWVVPEHFNQTNVYVSKENDGPFPEATRYLSFGQGVNVRPSKLSPLKHLLVLYLRSYRSTEGEVLDLKAPLEALRMNIVQDFPSPLPHTLTEINVSGAGKSLITNWHVLPASLTELTALDCALHVDDLFKAPPQLRRLVLGQVAGELTTEHFKSLPRGLIYFAVRLDEPYTPLIESFRFLPRKLSSFDLSCNTFRSAPPIVDQELIAAVIPFSLRHIALGADLSDASQGIQQRLADRLNTFVARVSSSRDPSTQ